MNILNIKGSGEMKKVCRTLNLTQIVLKRLEDEAKNNRISVSATLDNILYKHFNLKEVDNNEAAK